MQQAHHRIARQGGRVRLSRSRPRRARAGARAVRRRLVEEKRKEAAGQDSLFAAFAGFGDEEAETPALQALPAIPAGEWDKQTLLGFEREMLGLYVSDHPLFGIEHILANHADTSIAAVTAAADDDHGGANGGGGHGPRDGHTVTIAGLITSLQLKRTKKGDLWAIVTVEDLEGAIECLFFPSTYMTVSTMLSTDTVVVVKGRINRRDDSVSLYAQELTLPDITEGPRPPVVLTMDTLKATTGRIEELKAVLANHPGATEVQLRLVKPGRRVELQLDAAYRVTASDALFGDLKVLLGPRCLSGG